MTDYLISAKEMLNDAKVGLQELEYEMGVFFQSKPYQSVVERDSKRNVDTHKIKMDREIPGKFRSKTRHIASDIRSLLDQLGYTTALADGKLKPRNTYFPFSSSVEFKESTRKRCKDIPNEIFDLFWSFEPFKDGDNVFWSLNEIANCNKHRSVVPVGNSLSGNQMIKNFNCEEGLIELAFPPRWDTDNNEAIICIVSSNSNVTYEINLSFDICFGDIEVLRGYPVLGVLKYIILKAEEVVKLTEIKGQETGLFV